MFSLIMVIFSLYVYGINNIICSFGGAATICTSEFPFSRCINYYAVNDPILNVVPTAVKALQSGFSFGSGMEQEIIFLASRTGK